MQQKSCYFPFNVENVTKKNTTKIYLRCKNKKAEFKNVMNANLAIFKQKTK